MSRGEALLVKGTSQRAVRGPGGRLDCGISGDPIPLSGEVQRAGVIRIAIDLTAGEGRSGQAENAEDDDLRR